MPIQIDGNGWCQKEREREVELERKTEKKRGQKDRENI